MTLKNISLSLKLIHFERRGNQLAQQNFQFEHFEPWAFRAHELPPSAFRNYNSLKPTESFVLY